MLLTEAGLQKTEQFVLTVRGFMTGLICIAEPSNKVIKINQTQNKFNSGVLNTFGFILLGTRKISSEFI